MKVPSGELRTVTLSKLKQSLGESWQDWAWWGWGLGCGCGWWAWFWGVTWGPGTRERIRV